MWVRQPTTGSLAALAADPRVDVLMHRLTCHRKAAQEVFPDATHENTGHRLHRDSMPGPGVPISNCAWRLATAAAERTGCRLASRFFWADPVLDERQRALAAVGRACFIMDLFGGILAGSPPSPSRRAAAEQRVAECARGHGTLTRSPALGLPPKLFPEIREANQPVGPLCDALAERTVFRPELPSSHRSGDHQAEFLGSVRDFHHDVLVNVGTGAQVGRLHGRRAFAPPAELRPPAVRNNLLSMSVWPADGATKAVGELFPADLPRRVSSRFEARYETLNRLAATVPPGCDGLVCDALFPEAGPIRPDEAPLPASHPRPDARSLRARRFGGDGPLARRGYRSITATEKRPRRRTVAAGNALRENAVLREHVREAFGLPLFFTRHREEAAFGRRPYGGRRSRAFPVAGRRG